LRKYKVAGGFPKDLFEALKARPEAVREVAREILASHFPDSLHAGLASATGLHLDAETRSARRDAGFRSSIVSVW
jgi:putative restriction endonuclease